MAGKRPAGKNIREKTWQGKDLTGKYLGRKMPAGKRLSRKKSAGKRTAGKRPAWKRPSTGATLCIHVLAADNCQEMDVGRAVIQSCRNYVNLADILLILHSRALFQVGNLKSNMCMFYKTDRFTDEDGFFLFQL